MMECALRCNTLTCRKELNEDAIVTTCSHIFCLDCATRLLSANGSNRLVCPACDQHLANEDDVARAKLHPSEDYKTSVLSGLNPNTIMECAGRAMNFWAYQTSQEILYQGMQARVLTDRYNKLKSQIDSIVRDANNEMSELRTELDNAISDLNNAQKKNHELAKSLHAKSKQQAHTQELYDKLKRRDQMNQVQNAASDAVDQTIQGSATANGYSDHFRKANDPPLRSPVFPSLQGNSMGPPPVPTSMPLSGVAGRTGLSNGWIGFTSQGNNNQGHVVAQTPSSQRQRLIGEPNVGIAVSNMNSRSLSTPMQPRHSPARGLFGGVRSNGSGGIGFAGYGMSAGLKVSHTPPLGVEGMRSMSRTGPMPRVAQRPASATFMGGRSSVYGEAPGLSNQGGFY
ncbi:hypothetical protein VC83_05604 [Pseudogymnoascus destructans]|uniref:RING-type domain-containing protein n=2 Tax=Pseudogymnoascus destructans TaxID=655981 RepID=L8FTF8_PSED2|nr:uncharacterized protein VC83_05604 [Pseudogymnoascus destructans]ELR03773.1 hypothetical protein GMDG_06400 [Pseudogymnoascus destructans 20631-21]OAF57665.1 hypothetical protein VC83_05604 [Pseudogymnoascus destructans]